MTRVTNFGRKRTYLEAGFAEREDTTTSEPKVDEHVQSTTPVEPAEASAGSPKEKSKPAKKAKTKKISSHSNPNLKAQGDSEASGEPNDSSTSLPAADSEGPKRPRKRHRSKKGKGPLGFSQVKKKEDGDDASKPAQSERPAAAVRPVALQGWERKKDGGTRPLEDQSKALSRSRRADPREDRRMKRIEDKQQETTCFACREKGHAARDCPKTSEMALGVDESRLGSEDEEGAPKKKGGKPAPVVGICYRCGSNQHNLSRCKKPADSENPLPFASCFVCSGKGHLAGACPQNQNRGVYPNGGCCKICGDTTHLAKDCVVRRNDSVTVKPAVGTGADAGADEDDFMVLKRRAREVDKEEKQEEKWKMITEALEQAPARSNPSALSNGLSVKKKVVVF